jgi:hypothetical protein
MTPRQAEIARTDRRNVWELLRSLAGQRIHRMGYVSGGKLQILKETVQAYDGTVNGVCPVFTMDHHVGHNTRRFANDDPALQAAFTAYRFKHVEPERPLSAAQYRRTMRHPFPASAA